MVATIEQDLAPPIERIHRPGESLTRTINRILRAGVTVLESVTQDNT